MSTYPLVVLKAGREKSVYFHHPWIFSRAIETMPKNLENGALVQVKSHDGILLGIGYYNFHSQIALRLFSFFDEMEVNQGFFERKFKQLFDFRQSFLDLRDTNAYRLVFGESDGLPGLVVDKYGDFLVIQIHTLGMDKLRDSVVKALVETFQPEGVYERSDLDVRKKEGLKNTPTGVLFGEAPPDLYEIKEHGVKFFVDIKGGQKTGFFLDQRENRLAVRAYSKGKSILNLFSYSGGFSVSALAGKAREVTSVDISEPALEIARKNFELNGFSNKDNNFICKDVFTYLDACIAENKKFDLVIVDPPAFVKNKESLNAAVNAYIRLNEKALRLLNKGGILTTSSCSSHVTQEIFRTILFRAALKVGVQLTILESKFQPFDHPLNINFPEGEYLKFCVCVVH